MPAPTVIAGGCHCGAVRFSVRLREWVAVRCNCSICTMKGLLHAIVDASDFTLLSGEEFLTTYTFHTHTAKHTFCRLCGVQSFYTPRSHPDGIDVNVHCLDESVVDRMEIRTFNGEQWEESIHTLR